jgi:ribonuclease P protein component
LVSSALLAAVGISRVQRLKHRSEFAAVYMHGRPYRDGYLILRAIRTDRPVSRFGFTASKALGGAVVRNRVKRRLREITAATPVADGWDMILNARSKSVSASFADLCASTQRLMRRAGVLQ